MIDEENRTVSPEEPEETARETLPETESFGTAPRQTGERPAWPEVPEKPLPEDGFSETVPQASPEVLEAPLPGVEELTGSEHRTQFEAPPELRSDAVQQPAQEEETISNMPGYGTQEGAFAGIPAQPQEAVPGGAPQAQPCWEPYAPPAYSQTAPAPNGYFPQGAPGYPQPPREAPSADPWAQYAPPVQPGAPYGQPPQVYPYYGQTAWYPYPVQQKKKMSTGLKVFLIIACVLVFLALAGFVGFVGYNVVNNVTTEEEHSYKYPFEQVLPDLDPSEDQEQPERPDRGEDTTPDFDDNVTPPDTDEPLPEVDVTPNDEGITIHEKPAGSELSAQQVYEKVVKSTVTVAVTREVSGAEQNSTGTGIIATSDGYIITNSHVVLNSKSSRVKIITCDGEEYDAVVVGYDRTTDLAVLKTNDYGFTPAEFGDSEQLVIGDSVIAIGNPGGEKFSGSMTGGYVSGLDRAVGTYSENGMTYLQTDAAINPGNSGGPLVNMYGQVVGINSSKIISEGFEGMGFAIPISKAQPIIDQLLSGGYVKGRVRLGITGMDSSNTQYAFLGNMPQGFVISEINDDSSFVGTDAQVGDIIIGIDGETVTCLEEISNLLLKYAPGDSITVTLYRPSSSGGEEIEVQITLLEDKGETQN